MKKNNFSDKALEVELRTHLDIMQKLSKVSGHEESYVYINGICHYWHVDVLPVAETIEIAHRGNHEEILFMIHQYGKAAPPYGWDAHKWCNPYHNDHILPDEVQEIIATRCDDEEIDAYILYQGFGLTGQRKFYAASTHEQRMRYLERHGFLPEIQDLLRTDDNQDEIDLHIVRHGMHSGWENEVIKSHNFELFKHSVDLHGFSVSGQHVFCQKATTEEFLYYIAKYGFCNEVHADMVSIRTKEEIRQYIAKHRYLSFEGEKALCKRNDHDLMMNYISNKHGDLYSLLQAFDININKWRNEQSKKPANEHVKRDYIAIAACLLRENMHEKLKEMEMFLMQEENEEQITEYILWRKPCNEAVKALLNRCLQNAIHTYCSKWML